jgi:hypothetical protein
MAPVMVFEITSEDAAKLQELALLNNSVFIEASPGGTPIAPGITASMSKIF